MSKWVKCKSKKYGGTEANRKMEAMYNTPPPKKFFARIIDKLKDTVRKKL